MCLDILFPGYFIIFIFIYHRRIYLILESDMRIQVVGVQYRSVVVKTAELI